MFAAANAYDKRHPVHSWTLIFSCCLQAAQTLGMVSVDVPGAGETDTQTVQSLVSKKTSTATPAAAVPVETSLVPATPVATVPPVAVSGMVYSHVLRNAAFDVQGSNAHAVSCCIASEVCPDVFSMQA